MQQVQGGPGPYVQLPPPTPPPAPKPPAPNPAPAPPSGNPYNSDPGYQAALAQEQLGIQQSQAALSNLINQRLVQLGDPSLAGQYGVNAAAVQQNTLAGNSQLARLNRQHSDNLRAVINQLAAHGLLQSGDTGYQTGREDQSYGNAVYDAQQAALADILGYRNSALQQQQQLHQSVIDALQNAYQTYLNHPELGGYGQTTTYPGTTGVVGDPNAFGTADQVAAALRRYNQNQNRNLYG